MVNPSTYHREKEALTETLARTHLPRFQIPEGCDAESYLAELARQGLDSTTRRLPLQSMTPARLPELRQKGLAVGP